jgi:hypothetical protein
MQKRTIVTAINPDWLIGFVEERADESAPWRRSLHSDWVFARIGDRQGEHAEDDPEQFPIPSADSDEPTIVGEPGESLHDMLRRYDEKAELVDVMDRLLESE